jgi:hypothetical protein
VALHSSLGVTASTRAGAWAGLVAALLMLPSMAAFAGFTVIGLIFWTAAVGVWLARGRSVELTT